MVGTYSWLIPADKLCLGFVCVLLDWVGLLHCCLPTLGCLEALITCCVLLSLFLSVAYVFDALNLLVN